MNTQRKGAPARSASESIPTGIKRKKFITHYKRRKQVSKQYTEEEQVELIMKALEPRVGKRATVKRNLVYLMTEEEESE
jgi:hypothetical protein